MSAFVYSVNRDGSDVLVIVVGELDATSVAEMADAVDATIADGGRHPRMDLAGVTFIAAGAIGWLVRLRRVVGELDGSLAVVAPSDCVRRLCTLIGVHDDLGVLRLAWPTSVSAAGRTHPFLGPQRRVSSLPQRP